MKTRPVVFDYGSSHVFLRELFDYYKEQGRFSLRQRVSQVGGCSQALLSQIIAGRRLLNRQNLPPVAEVFRLTKIEREFLEKKLAHRAAAEISEPVTSVPRAAKNHLLSDWLNAYVKDLVNLNGFKPEPERIERMLMGIASSAKIARSVRFLFAEGFWRRELGGRVVPEDSVVVSTNEIPNEKIRAFHRRALEIAIRGLSVFPSHRRKSSTVLLSLDSANLDELRTLLDSFQRQLLEFVEKNPAGGDALVQVTLHMTPVGVSDVEK